MYLITHGAQTRSLAFECVTYIFQIIYVSPIQIFMIFSLSLCAAKPSISTTPNEIFLQYLPRLEYFVSTEDVFSLV